MNYKIGSIFLLICLFAALFWFVGKPYIENSRKSKLDGEVFIVTKGGANMKLGLVPIKIKRVNENRILEEVDLLKTNADGKFSITLPYGEYVISATSERKIFDGTEYYSWNVPVKLDKENVSIMLSNDNLSN